MTLTKDVAIEFAKYVSENNSDVDYETLYNQFISEYRKKQFRNEYEKERNSLHIKFQKEFYSGLHSDQQNPHYIVIGKSLVKPKKGWKTVWFAAWQKGNNVRNRYNINKQQKLF